MKFFVISPHKVLLSFLVLDFSIFSNNFTKSSDFSQLSMTDPVTNYHWILQTDNFVVLPTLWARCAWLFGTFPESSDSKSEALLGHPFGCYKQGNSENFLFWKWPLFLFHHTLADTAWQDCSLDGTIPPDNGTVMCTSSNEVNSVCVYWCDDGFSLDGSTQVTCQPSGDWSNPVPRCESKSQAPYLYGTLQSIRTIK